MRKKVDERILTLIENGVKDRHRSIFVIIGDQYRDMIVDLHNMVNKSIIKARPSVLWCYKEKLEFSSHTKTRAKKVKKLGQRVTRDPEKADSFSLFIEGGAVSHCKYRDSERILGNTYAMCILQDFEALTPNILARTIETVEGGGLVIILLHPLSTLTSFYTMVMDVHERFKTEAHSEIVSRFNERFLLSLASCKGCLVMDDEFNILPISSQMTSIMPSTVHDHESTSVAQEELKNLKEKLYDVVPVGRLVQICSTLDQGKCVSTFLDAILDKSFEITIALTAARGRGKSAALGLAIAGAVAVGYSRIFVTAPSPENLKSLFDFVCRGLCALNYQEHLHYDIGRSTNPEFRRAVTHINIYKEHRQTIQYIQPQDHAKLSQAELLVIDEAAAIPLPIVKKLLGPYLAFISSTVNGYEGTGRSLSLKLFQHLEKQSQISTGGANSSHSGRLFQKMELNEPIRYALGDPVESWLDCLLCLDITNSIPHISRFPHPTECNLFYVNRDTLFSYHKESEIFLQRMVSLFVSSHYKNSPNDLQLMADAPAHHLFVLLGPVDEKKNILPHIFCAIQVCLEGEISRKSVLQNLQMGRLPSGDQIPWKFCEKFGSTNFPTLSGVRIVRIAVHPNATGHGYGSAALELLTRYYEGKLTAIDEANVEDSNAKFHDKIIATAKEISLLEETITPRENLPPLLVHPYKRLHEKVHYIGASFGLNPDLFRFWKKHNYTPFYICDIPNNTTGEHSCMVLKPLETIDAKESLESLEFLTPFYQCFKREFLKKLPLCFKDLDYKLTMSILDPKIKFSEDDQSLTRDTETSMLVKLICSPHEFELLEGYANNRKGYEEVKHLQQQIAYWYFEGKFPISLSHLQASLLCMGLQLHDTTYIEEQMKIGRQQVMTLMRKMMLKFYKYFFDVKTKDFDVTLPLHRQEKMKLQTEEANFLEQHVVEEVEIEQALKRCSKVQSSNETKLKKRTRIEG